ncbi:penicillin-binding protein activator [Idiomarina seosinensis]|uniref:penicillin-binding protein activator n=1 Tax=Idiomarina seosinensis TaxID=281739 RepID=UPI0018E50E3B|nr:penicillin-binding protein activator [Idiomarina seosinensis]
MRSHFTNSVKGVAVALLSAIVLTQCSSVQKPADDTEFKQPVESISTQPDGVARTAEQWLDEAVAAETPADQQYALIGAALAFQQQQQWQKSAAVIGAIEAAEAPVTNENLPQFQLAKAHWHFKQQQWQQAIKTIEPSLKRLNKRDQRLQALTLVADSHARLGEYWQAAISQIEAEQFSQHDSATAGAEAIWRYLRQASSHQLPDRRPLTTNIAGWWRVAKSFHQYQQQPKQLAQQFQQWLSSYPDHHARQIVEQWLAADWQAPENIIALLPLSGRYALQGTAVRDGLIAAAAESTFTIRFIDTNRYNVEQQREQALQANATHIIGPLLKQQVQAWLQQPLIGPYHLFLNEADTPESGIINQRYLQFALAPEDEARQAAARISEKTERAPLLFSVANASGQRLVNSFQQRWQQQDNPPAEVGWYNQQSEMQGIVEERLGISGSKERIRQVKIAAGKIIIDEQERSRADIDAVYLPGNLEQVRLLKPFIDVNLSPFAPPLTVFGSSAVHERSNMSGDADLSGVEFSESPAILGQHNKSNYVMDWLQKRSNARLSDARLFNMGYDSVYLLQQAALLNFVPGINWSGFNGQLSVSFNRVQRELDWAIFKDNKVQPIE